MTEGGDKFFAHSRFLLRDKEKARMPKSDFPAALALRVL